MSLFSFAEEIAEVYFSKNYYLTTRNSSYLDPNTKGNRDIDLIAYNGKSLLIISCKRGSLNKEGEKKELLLFKQAKKVIKNKFPFIKDKPKFVYIAEFITKPNEEFFKENKIKYYKLIDIIEDLIKKLRDEIGNNKLDGRESYISSRLLKFLIKNNFITKNDT